MLNFLRRVPCSIHVIVEDHLSVCLNVKAPREPFSSASHGGCRRTGARQGSEVQLWWADFKGMFHAGDGARTRSSKWSDREQTFGWRVGSVCVLSKRNMKTQKRMGGILNAREPA